MWWKSNGINSESANAEPSHVVAEVACSIFIGDDLTTFTACVVKESVTFMYSYNRKYLQFAIIKVECRVQF